MGTVHTRQLDDLFRDGKTFTSEAKALLTKLSTELTHRVTIASPKSETFFLDAMRSLSKIKGGAFVEIRLECLQACAHYFYVSGYSEAALQTGKHMLALATKANDRPWIRKCETLLGIFLADCGNVAESIIHYVQALEVAKAIGDQPGIPRVLLNLGTALNYAGLHQEAIPCLEMARRVASSEIAPECVDGARTNLAQSYLYMEDYRSGLREIARDDIQQGLVTDSARALSLTIREVTYTQLALEVGDYSLARIRVKECRRFADWSGTVRSMLLAQFIEGLCDVHFGDVQKGLASLEECSSKAKSVRAVYALSLIGLVRAYELAENPSKALFHLRILQSYIRKIRSQSALALMSSASSLGEHLHVEALENSLVALENREFKLRALAAESEILDSRLEMLDRLAVTADLREESSGEHGYRVGRLSSTFARDLGWSDQECAVIDLAARLHDIGKIGVPDRILLNSQELKEAERHLMSTHTLIGSELLAKSNIPQLRMAEEIARCHHEWWNGTGYPAKLSGKRIPIHARIVALADVFDAMTHGRPYSEPWEIDRALAEILKLRGEQFDPDLTDRFIDLIRRLRKEHVDLDEFLGRAGRNSPFLKARHKIREMLAAEQARETATTGDLVAH